MEGGEKAVLWGMGRMEGGWGEDGEKKKSEKGTVSIRVWIGGPPPHPPGKQNPKTPFLVFAPLPLFHFYITSPIRSSSVQSGPVQARISKNKK